MKKLMFVVLVGLFLTGCKPRLPVIASQKRIADIIFVCEEWAYLEGQIDAIEGNIRIKKNEAGDYYWTKSCWDNGKETRFLYMSQYKEYFKNPH